MTKVLQHLKLSHGIVLLCIIQQTKQYYELSIESADLCSKITKRRINLTKDEPALIVKQTHSNYHPIEWKNNDLCTFQVSSAYGRNGGIIAVVQYLNFRKNDDNECLDFVQFQPKNEPKSRKYCGMINASRTMEEGLNMAGPLIYQSSIISVKEEMEVFVNISYKPLLDGQSSDLHIVFTSYKQCDKGHSSELKPCPPYNTYCIHRQFFNDHFINCPYGGCTDEGGCIKYPKLKPSVGNKVLISSVSALFFTFVLFILMVWACRKHKVFCWREPFLRPTTSIPEVWNSNVEVAASSTTPTAPAQVGDDKDPPPSYDSLFPAQNT